MFELDDEDHPGEEDGDRFGFDRSTALYWGVVFGFAVAVNLAFIRWISRRVNGAVCIGETFNHDCALANLVINDLAFTVLVTYTVIAALWVVRAKPRDANPVIVTFVGWLGVIAGFLAAWALSEPMAQALHIRQSALVITIVAVVAAVFAALSTLLRPKRPKQRWRRAVVVALPITALCLIGVTLRTDHEVRGILTDTLSQRVEGAINRAERSAERFPERQHKHLATEWLEQPVVLVDAEQGAAIEEKIGPIDAIGHGRDFRAVVEGVVERAVQKDRAVEDVAVEMVDPNGTGQTLLQIINIIGRRGSGYCLARTTVEVDEKTPFYMFDKHPYPRATTRFRPRLCVIEVQGHAQGDGAKGGLLDTFDDSGQAPRQASRDHTHIVRNDDGPFAPNIPGLNSESYWAKNVALELGFAPDQPKGTGFDELSASDRANYLLEAIQRTQRAPYAPRRQLLRPVFGNIIDAFSTDRLNRITDHHLHRYHRRDGLHTVNELAEGFDVARFIVGEARSGWCVYRLKTSAAPGENGAIIRAAFDFELRYCLAGDELYSFEPDRPHMIAQEDNLRAVDREGEIDRVWNATGLPRRAPLFNPSDISKLSGTTKDSAEQIADRRARDRLIKQFLDGLVAGDLDDVSQLETISLARGADLLEPSTKDAMRRMLESSEDADTQDDTP
jgi:hypothetical protein